VRYGRGNSIVCKCPGIKSIRVRLYRKALLLPEEVKKEPQKNSSVCIGDWAAKLGNRGGTMGKA